MRWGMRAGPGRTVREADGRIAAVADRSALPASAARPALRRRCSPIPAPRAMSRGRCMAPPAGCSPSAPWRSLLSCSMKPRCSPARVFSTWPPSENQRAAIRPVHDPKSRLYCRGALPLIQRNTCACCAGMSLAGRPMAGRTGPPMRALPCLGLIRPKNLAGPVVGHLNMRPRSYC